MRYVIYGVGAVGGLIAARLHKQGHRVVLIARGQTYDVLARSGLQLADEEGSWTRRLEVARQPSELALTSEDCVILAMKTQDTLAAVQSLAAAAPVGMPIFCAQNGVENEPIAQRFFANVYGLYVYVFAATLVPGQVCCYTAPSSGVIDLGRFAGEPDACAHSMASDLRTAGFDSLARANIMEWKYAKLIANLGNALTASYGDASAVPDLYEAAQEEGRACLRAAGIAFVPKEEAFVRRRHLLPLKHVQGKPFPGSSAWQSLARGTGQTEVDYLSGEIVLLGRMHGVPTPLNSALQEQVRRMALNGSKPGSLDPREMRQLIAAS